MMEAMTPEVLEELIANSPYKALSNGELIKTMSLMKPDLVNGTDYWIGSFVDVSTNLPAGRAFLIWRHESDEPTIAEIDAFITDNESTLFAPPTVEELREQMQPLSRRQFRLGMRNLGITSQMITDAIDQIPNADQREVAQIEWEDAATFMRLNPFVLSISQTFGITAADLDEQWQIALTL